MCGVISFMTGIATGMIANWLALQSPKPQDHILVSLIVGGMIAGITMFLLVDSPNEI